MSDAAKFVEVEAWVIVDEDGDYRVGITADDAEEAYDSDVGGGTALARRVFCVKLKVPVPKVVELVADVPAETVPSGLTVRVA
jgi:hypothetical protein